MTLNGLLLQGLRVLSVVEISICVCALTIFLFNFGEQWQNVYLDFKE